MESDQCEPMRVCPNRSLERQRITRHVVANGGFGASLCENGTRLMLLSVPPLANLL
jgi:hypothetical protein